MPALLAAENLGHRFGPQWVLRGIGFELSAGAVLAVTGTNGSGKSTLLKILAGLISPSRGSVLRNHGNALRQTLGYSAPDLGLFPALTPEEILNWSAKCRQVDGDVPFLLDRVGLTDSTNKTAKELSTGQRARLRLALAIQTNPSVLLLDEPTANLDDAGTELVYSTVRAQRKRGVCVIATNDVRDLEICDEVLHLDA